MDKAFLLAELQSGPVKIKFTKRDGTVREMTCTLNETYLPEREHDNGKQAKKENPEVQSVWDLEKNSWRSFRWDSILYDHDHGLG